MVGVHNRVLDEKNRTSLQILYSLRQGRENESANPVQFPKQEDLNTFTLMAQDPDSNFEVIQLLDYVGFLGRVASTVSPVQRSNLHLQDVLD